MGNKNFNSLFDGIRRVDVKGNEYWSARELLPLLGYSSWQRAEGVIQRAMGACAETGNEIADHFNASVKMVTLGSRAKRELDDYNLSRFGAYLTAQNCDPRGRPQVAAAQVYFAVKTRQQEIGELLAGQKQRVELREHVTELNKKLADAAQDSGVPSHRFGIFQDEGYKGLYGGLGAAEIKDRKAIPARDDILDRMGSVELGANIFRITQTEDKLKRERITGEANANAAHYEMGKKVRQFIEQEGNTLPEDLPPEPSIKAIIDERKRTKKKLPQKSDSQPSLFDLDTGTGSENS